MSFKFDSGSQMALGNGNHQLSYHRITSAKKIDHF